MLIEFIQSNEIIRNIILIILLLSVFRTIFVLGILFAVITAKVLFFNKPLLNNHITNRTSLPNTFEVIFFHFLGVKTKPFLPKAVY